MKTLLLIISLTIFIPSTRDCLSQVTQEWVARYNGPANNSDEASSLAVDGSGNVYVTGYSYGTDGGYVTIKYNSSGDSLWVARSNNSGSSLAVDGSGNVYVTGSSEGSGTGSDYATIKYNSAGDTLWVARYNGPVNSTDIAFSLAVDGSGNVYVTGYSNGGSGAYPDYATIKYNSSGDSLWVRRYNGPGNSDDEAVSIAVDGSGNVYVTGSSTGSGTERDYATIKYNSSGDSLWVARYNGPGNWDDWARSLAVDGSGNVYVTGNSYGSGTYDHYATIKYNSSGVQQWAARYSGSVNGYDGARSLAVDGSGNVYVTGYSWGSGTSEDYATIKYNSSGDSLWVRRYNGPGNSYDAAYSLAVDSSGNVYVTGRSFGSGADYDYATIKYNSSGVQQWLQRYNGPGNNIDAATSLAVDGSGNVYVTGRSFGSGTEYDYATIKYSQLVGINITMIVEGFYNIATNDLNMKDTVRTYLRSTVSPFAIVDSAKSVIDSLTFKGNFFFNNAPSGLYYIILKHRNSIETWSKSRGETISQGETYLYNFTNSSSQAYGNNMIQKGTKFCIYSGDVNQDGVVDGSDAAIIDNDAFNFVTGYVVSDVTGDDVTDATDAAIADNNAANFVSIARP